jgi:small subunit ribosomal protein S5
MSENKEQTAEKTQQTGVDTTTTKDAPKKDAETKTDAPKTDARGGRGGARRSFGNRKPGGFRKGSRFRGDRPKPEFEQKIINISRVTRVVKGGRRLSFRVDMVIGDKKGRVGLGSGKATDTSLAIQKAFNQARKNLILVDRTKTNSIPFETSAKVTSSEVILMPNKQRGLVAGSTVRNILEFAGITDVTAKIHSRSRNKLNNAKAGIKALEAFSKKAPAKVINEEKKGPRKGRFVKRNHNRS